MISVYSKSGKLDWISFRTFSSSLFSERRMFWVAISVYCSHFVLKCKFIGF